MKKTLLVCAALMGSVAMSAQYSHVVQAEKLDRGVLAVKADKGVFVSWRAFASDDKNLAFDVYRNGTKINSAPIKKCTNYTDAGGNAGDKYVVKAVLDSEVKETSKEVAAWDTFYKKIHLDRPAGGTFKDNNKLSDSKGKVVDDYTYTPDDVSVADVDGDGEWEYIVKWFPSNQADNSFQWKTGKTYLDCYKLDGTKLWRIDLGINIRSGNHYTQFMVYDFNRDGKAELICKTAPGTIDGQGKAVLMGDDKADADYRTGGNADGGKGTILKGSEYLTVFNGETGAEIHTIAYNPPRTVQSSSSWGDSYGNRCERYLAGVAYLDGNDKNPSAIFCRGYYTHSYLWAVNFDGTKLTEKWFHASTTKGQGAYGEGAHSLTIGDVDGDGKDEIVYGAASIDHDGKLLYRTGAGHGDALHLTDMIPDRQGLEVFMPHEEKSSSYKWDTECRDARTGEIIYGEAQSGNDIGRGLAANVTSKYPGYETWSATNKIFNNGVEIGSSRPSVNFRIYWDGDLLDELLDGTKITKPNSTMSSNSTLMNFSSYSSAASCNTTKATPNLQADLFGDWREEVILHDGSTESDLIIFTTTTPSDYKVPTLMQDRQYRVAIAWQNVAYNQPPHLSYNLEESFNTAGAVMVTAGNLNQVVDLGDAMTPIEFNVIRATGATVTGLPEGVEMTFDAATLTGKISGTPAAEGEFTFTITTTGAEEDNNGYSEGVIKVRRNTNLNLIAQFEFEKAGETTVNNIHGAATVAGNDAAIVEGKKGNAISLGGNSYMTQEGYDALDFKSKDFTIEMWLKSADDGAYILQKGTMKNDPAAGTTGNWVGLELKNGALRFAVDDDVTKSEVQWSEGSSIFNNEWHHVVLVRDTYAKQLLMYVDGELKNTAEDATGAVNCPNELLIIGNSADLNNTLNGSLDELAIYQGAMSAAKVKERFETTGKELAYFPMDELGETTPNKVFGEAAVNGTGIQVVEGLKAGALSFNDNGYLTQTIYDAINMGESDFTIEMWMKSTDDDGYLLCIGTHNTTNVSGGTGNWIGLERKNGYLCFSIDDDAKKTDCKLDDASAAFDGNWHHIAAVRDFAGKTLTLYVDGQEVQKAEGVTTGALNQSATELMFIGGDDESGNRTFAGAIDELVITPKALSAAEVEANYDLLKLSGIEDVTFNNANATYTVVDAMSGIIIRTAVGVDREDILDGLDKGVYILVVEDGKTSNNYKFVKQ